MPSVYIILLNYNGWKDTVECLESLMRSHYANFKAVVCDNASTDDSVDKIKSWAKGLIASPNGETLDNSLMRLVDPPLLKPIKLVEYSQDEIEQHIDKEHKENGNKNGGERSVILIRNRENKGFSAGNNVGIQYAMSKNADFLWILNNDTVVEPDALKELVYRMDADRTIGAAGTVIYFASEPDRIQAYGGGKIISYIGLDRFVLGPGPLHYIAGTSLFVRRKVFEQVGLLDDGFFFYWEDADFSRRVLKKNWKIGVASNSVVYHKFSATIGKQSMGADKFKAASLTRYFKKHYRFWWWFPVSFHMTLMVFNRMRRGQFKRVGPIIKESVKAVRFNRKKLPLN